MNFADPIAWYVHDQARRQKHNIDNQKSLSRQVFDRAVQSGLIEIATLPNRQQTVIVKAEPGRVVAHFNHHPDMFRTIPFNSAYLSSHKDDLERTLTQAWQYVNSPTVVNDLPHF